MWNVGIQIDFLPMSQHGSTDEHFHFLLLLLHTSNFLFCASSWGAWVLHCVWELLILLLLLLHTSNKSHSKTTFVCHESVLIKHLFLLLS